MGEILGSEVTEAGIRVGEQVSEDDPEGTEDRDQGFELVTVFDDASVAFAEEGACFGGHDGGLAERGPFRQGLTLPVIPPQGTRPDWTVRGQSLAHDTRVRDGGGLRVPLSMRIVNTWS